MVERKTSPYFTVIMPAFRTPPRLLREAVASVRAQSFRDWELIVVDDGSDDSLSPAVDAVARGDRRVRFVRLPVNSGIVVASNEALARAGGRWIAPMDHDDLLAPQALERCAAVLDRVPGCDFLYTDEEWIDMDGLPLGPFLKPDWSPERMRAQNYVNHLSVYRRSLVDSVGGFRPGFDGSQDYDLVLRVSERATRVEHLPEILYQWRVRPGQVSGSANPAVYQAARQAIEEHCERIGFPGRVEQTDPLGVYRVHRQLPRTPLVSVVIPTRGSSGVVFGAERVFVQDAVRSILERSTYPHLELVVVADRSTPEEVAESLVEQGGDRLRLVWYERPFNYAHKVNIGVSVARGELVVLLNDDVEVVSPDWIETMAGHALQADVGMVGAALYFEDGTVQHGGHLYVNSVPGHIAYGAAGDDPGPMSAMRMERECSGVTAACAMLRRSDYLAVGGLSRRLPVNFNDVDLSLKIRATGKRIVWTPFARLYHFESRSRDVGVGLSEVHAIQARWGRALEGDDPYWRYPAMSEAPADLSDAQMEAEFIDDAATAV